MKLIGKTNIDFMGKRKIFYTISLSVILAGIISISIKGLNLGLDFTGGTLLQLKFNEKMEIAKLRKLLKEGDIDASIREFEDNSYAILIKGKQENVNEYANKVIDIFNKNGIKFIEEKRDFVGPIVGKELTKKAVFAIVLSMFGIVVYIAFRFANPVWGITGVIALLHDVFVAISAMSLTNREIDLVIVAALLTIAGYSINDTIVIYDRMRENLKKFPKMPLKDLLNLSINETLSRTIITVLTVIIVLVVLYFFGGSAINDFAFCMLVGNISGVYSTIAIATSLGYEWQK
jgi:preprotein translocase subunit SecF